MGKKHAGKGFTLVEIIVTLCILVVLAAATYGGVKQYLAHAEQTVRDETARDLFLASQSALSNLYANDPAKAAELAASAPSVALDRIRPQPAGDEWARELSLNAENIATLVLNIGDSGRSHLPLWLLLDSFVDDKTVLNNSILIEFNRVTGNVLACFYSDKVKLGHGVNYDVYDRSEGALSAGRVGYYGVEFTGVRAAREVVEEEIVEEIIGEPSILLVDYDGTQAAGDDSHHNINDGKNYGLFTAELALPPEADEDGNEYLYTLYITASTGRTVTLTLGKDDTVANIAWRSLPSTLEAALAAPATFTDAGGTERSAALYRMPVGDAFGRPVIVLLLDSVLPDYGIQKVFPELADGFLTATLAAATADGTASREAVSTTRHALYNGMSDAGVAGVSSIRHLNNVRYHADGKYLQSRDIDAQDHLGNILSFVPIDDNGSGSFSGSYNGANYRIRDLRVQESVRAGLFRRLSGSVTRVYLEECEIESVGKTTGNDGSGGNNGNESGDNANDNYAGGIAAQNAGGTITRCTVTGRVTAGASGAAGGIAGTNSKDIRACYVGAFVSAGTEGKGQSAAAGGVAGETTGGTIAYCEVGTGTTSKTQASDSDLIRDRLIGKPYFGARAASDGYSNTDYLPSGYNSDWGMINNYFTVAAYGGKCSAGGIAGRATGTEITYCVNAAAVSGRYAKRAAAGGIVGTCTLEDKSEIRTVIQACYNAGNILAEGYAGGVVGYLMRGRVDSCYNTGLVNASRKPLVSGGSYVVVPEFSLVASNYSGGVVGLMGESGSENVYLRYCYSVGYTGGFTFANNGVVGELDTQKDDRITLCYFLKNNLNEFSSYRWKSSWFSSEGVDKKSESGMRLAKFDDTMTALHTYDGTSGTVGAFAYPYPYLVSKDEGGTLGKNFHRTPWKILVG